eukprot:GDKK01064245.1.p3 GENE.GDKK01064245.1~~GDKK01064245.1.p3  ORF type:complete len:105 (+),score=0.11 GDKK01064245.1:126-440(+)
MMMMMMAIPEKNRVPPSKTVQKKGHYMSWQTSSILAAKNKNSTIAKLIDVEGIEFGDAMHRSAEWWIARGVPCLLLLAGLDVVNIYFLKLGSQRRNLARSDEIL